ncbi:NAD-dependent epimerase/dehydratase family protein [Halofilum ochraceum]|uniref:NAD-dependent epimerase/dehydratase family protein n=1 Tax=Halofilum ochraceum TaxID=1611323 RepID=UPI000946E2B8|nr:NAD(P)-dependent oxidoreductase [Halofilum ochraceum]
MRVLVTGHKGFIGTVMVPILVNAGHEVTGLDSDLYRASTYGEMSPLPPRELIKDVRDIEAGDLEGIDAVVHLAALSNDMLGDLNPEWTWDINYRASVRVAELARDCGVGRFVFASSCSMYGASGGDAPLDETAAFNPVTAYAKSKVLVEQEVTGMATDNFSPVFMRNATAYGLSPRIRFDVVINNLTAWAYTTGQVLMKSDGSPWRPLVHIADISRSVLAVLEAPREAIHNRAFNIGADRENYRIRELAEMVRDVVPECELGFAEGAGPDQRNYRVSFARFAQAFPAYVPQWTAHDGILELYEGYRRIGLDRDDYEGSRYKRIAQLQQRLAAGDLDDTLRWRHQVAAAGGAA